MRFLMRSSSDSLFIAIEPKVNIIFTQQSHFYFTFYKEYYLYRNWIFSTAVSIHSLIHIIHLFYQNIDIGQVNNI